jgi:hypothetical protein
VHYPSLPSPAKLSPGGAIVVTSTPSPSSRSTPRPNTR